MFEDDLLFVVDFGAHPALGPDPARIEPRVTTSAREITAPNLEMNPATGRPRLDFTLKGDVPRAELRAKLWRDGQRVAEVWLSRWVAA